MFMVMQACNFILRGQIFHSIFRLTINVGLNNLFRYFKLNANLYLILKDLKTVYCTIDLIKLLRTLTKFTNNEYSSECILAYDFTQFSFKWNSFIENCPRREYTVEFNV